MSDGQVDRWLGTKLAQGEPAWARVVALAQLKAGLVLRVEELATGHSRYQGRIFNYSFSPAPPILCLHLLHSCSPAPPALLAREVSGSLEVATPSSPPACFHFRVEERAVRVFPPGTSSAVL